MTIHIPKVEVKPDPLLDAAEEMCRDAAADLHRTIREIRAGNLGEAKNAPGMIRDLRAAFHLAMEERTRVEKQRKQEAGIVHDYALDFEQARDEIGRRLARLRDAGGD